MLVLIVRMSSVSRFRSCQDEASDLLYRLGSQDEAAFVLGVLLCR